MSIYDIAPAAVPTATATPASARTPRGMPWRLRCWGIAAGTGSLS